jgi:hypothetical protein
LEGDQNRRLFPPGFEKSLQLSIKSMELLEKSWQDFLPFFLPGRGGPQLLFYLGNSSSICTDTSAYLNKAWLTCRMTEQTCGVAKQTSAMIKLTCFVTKQTSAMKEQSYK